jgi:small redox-active disulfide protein 2
MDIKVVGSGCKNCKNLLNITRTAVSMLAIDSPVVYVTEMADIMATGLLNLPGLIVNGKVKSTGRVPSLSEVVKLIRSEM